MDLKPISIKVKWAEIVTTKSIHRKKIDRHRRYMQDFMKMKKMRGGSKLGITYVWYRELLTIANWDELRICVGLVVWDVVQIRREMVNSPCVRDPCSLIGCRSNHRSSRGHGSRLSRWLSSLIRIIHPLIAINCCVTRFVTNLACRTRIWVCRQRLDIWLIGIVIVEITFIVVILESSSSTTTLIAAS